MLKGLLLMLSLSMVIAIKAQPVNNAYLQDKFSQYYRANPITSLFLHIDKSIYTNNEKIWFSAYLLNRASLTKQHTLLNIFLFRKDSRKTALHKKFKIAEGLSAGSIILPDTIASGSYQLVAYTNVLDKQGLPLGRFSTSIEVKSITQQSFSSNIELLDSVMINGTVRAKVSVTGIAAKPAKWPAISYSVSNNFKDSVILKKNSSFIINIPQKELIAYKPKLHVTVRYQKQIQHLSTALPEIKHKQINIRFFPEGGNLANNLPAKVTWEAKTDQGVALALTGILLKNNKSVDTLKTNNYGIGSFHINPDGKSIYKLKITAGSYLAKDTVFALPVVTATGLSIQIAKAVVNDTLRAMLFAKESKPIHILLHNYQGNYILLQTKTQVPARVIKIPLSMLPKGLATITILDNQGQPLAERLFFAHYDERLEASITTEKEIYKKRDSIKVNLKLADKAGKPLQGIFSIAAVQENRLSSSITDIESYFYLNQSLNNLPQSPTGAGYNDPEYLENILLTRGWRRYTWQQICKSIAKDTVQSYSSPAITGNVRHHNKPLKAPVSLVILHAKAPSPITTSQDGKFTLTHDHLLTNQHQQIILGIAGNKPNYQIQINDPYKLVNDKLAQQYELGLTGSLSNNLNSADQELKGMAKTISLQAVEIKARKGSIYGFKGEPGTNACGDYVDEHDYLNYEYSENRFKPIEGKLYLIRTDLRGGRTWFKVTPVVYHGCLTKEKAFGIAINGIYGGKEYYGKLTDNDDMLYQSTLHWEAGLTTNAEGEATFTFKTGDLSDNFKIIIQGVSNDGVFSATKDFTVE